MSAAESRSCGPHVEFVLGALPALDENVLAAFVYGTTQPATGDARFVNAGFATANGVTAVELWRSRKAVMAGEYGPIRFAADGDYLFGSLELEEPRAGGLLAAAEEAYRALSEFQAAQAQRHLLRVWNHLYAINDGEGDLERYRQFCLGRARGLGNLQPQHLPAGTAVGRRNRPGLLQICWLAGREPGRPIGNPRQVQAYLYPRKYGPAPPSFSRAMLLPNDTVVGSGTASIVGHESRHDGNLDAQIDETLVNLRELIRAGNEMTVRDRPSLGLGRSVAAKVYLRCGGDSSAVTTRIRAGLSGNVSVLVLEADICRRELLVEIECSWSQ